MPLAFTDEEVKEMLNSVFEYTDKADIIKATGQNSTMVKENFNPEATRQSHAYLLLEMAVALADKSEERGDAFIKQFVTMYEVSKKRKHGKLSADREMANFTANANEVTVSRLSNETKYEQLVRLQKTEHSFRNARLALIEEIKNDLHQKLTPDNIGDMKPVTDFIKAMVEIREMQ